MIRPTGWEPGPCRGFDAALVLLAGQPSNEGVESGRQTRSQPTFGPAGGPTDEGGVESERGMRSQPTFGPPRGPTCDREPSQSTVGPSCGPTVEREPEFEPGNGSRPTVGPPGGPTCYREPSQSTVGSAGGPTSERECESDRGRPSQPTFGPAGGPRTEPGRRRNREGRTGALWWRSAPSGVVVGPSSGWALICRCHILDNSRYDAAKPVSS